MIALITVCAAVATDGEVDPTTTINDTSGSTTNGLSHRVRIEFERPNDVCAAQRWARAGDRA